MIHPSERAVKSRGSSSSIPLYVAGRDKPVAYVDPYTKILYKQVAEKHMLLRPRAIAFDVSVLHAAEKHGAVYIRVTHAETGRVMTCTVETFRELGFAVRRGFGNQWALALDAWSVDGQQPERDRQAEVQAAKAATAEMQQLDMFGGGAA